MTEEIIDENKNNFYYFHKPMSRIWIKSLYKLSLCVEKLDAFEIKRKKYINMWYFLHKIKIREFILWKAMFRKENLMKDLGDKSKKIAQYTLGLVAGHLM